MLHGETPTGMRHSDEIFDLYVRPYDDTIGNDSILMDVMHDLTKLLLLALVSQFRAYGLSSLICGSESEIVSLKVYVFKSSF